MRSASAVIPPLSLLLLFNLEHYKERKKSRGHSGIRMGIFCMVEKRAVAPENPPPDYTKKYLKRAGSMKIIQNTSTPSTVAIVTWLGY